MIDPRIRRYLEIPEDNPGDYLFITLPEMALANATVAEWIDDNHNGNDDHQEQNDNQPQKTF